ncbi:recombinase RecT [Pseudaeromonas pectinilytica]
MTDGNSNVVPMQAEAGTSGAFFEMMAPTLKAQGIEALLPSGVTFESFVRAAATAMAQNPDLANADRKSLIQSLIRCASHGLVPDGREAALVTFKEKQGNIYIMKAQYIPMVDGVLKRARQSGQIAVIAAKAVFDGDAFDYWMDEQGEHINYRPTYTGRGEFKLAFAFAKLHSGELIVEVMPKEDIERVRAASKTGSSEFGPWVKWFDRMSVKSVLHRLAKRLPSASELIALLESGEEMEWQGQAKSVSQPKMVSNKRGVAAVLEKVRKAPVTIDQNPQSEAQVTPDAQNIGVMFGQFADELEEAETIEQLAGIWKSAAKWGQSTGNEKLLSDLTTIKDERKAQLGAA